MSSFGPTINDAVRLPKVEPERRGETWVGRIEYVDRFGNLISNLTPQHIGELQSVAGSRSITVRIGDHVIQGLVASDHDRLSDTPAALINSCGRVEVL